MYINNLASEFKINVLEITKIPLLYRELLPYNSKAIEQIRHLYLKKVRKVVFSIIIMRPDNAQAISKLIKFLINLGPNYLKALDHNIYYLVLNKYLTIKDKAENKDSELITIMDKIFTVATDASYRNNLDRISGEEHIFKLFKDIIN